MSQMGRRRGQSTVGSRMDKVEGNTAATKYN